MSEEKPDVEVRIKRRAADKLISVWDDAHLEIDDFSPILESAWHARNRITSDFGCMLGAAETFRLVCEDCSPEVLDYFARDDRSADCQRHQECRPQNDRRGGGRVTLAPLPGTVPVARRRRRDGPAVEKAPQVVRKRFGGGVAARGTKPGSEGPVR